MTLVHTYLTALSPIEFRANDPVHALADVRETLRLHEQLSSPFRRCPNAHMVRLQVIDNARPPMGEQDAAPLRSSYLLLAAELDGSVDDFLDALYRADPAFVHALWGRCIGYPRHEGPVFFRRYIARCRLRGELPYAAFDVTVAHTLQALSLKERFGTWVAGTQGLDAAALQQRWIAERESLARPRRLKPGTF